MGEVTSIERNRDTQMEELNSIEAALPSALSRYGAICSEQMGDQTLKNVHAWLASPVAAAVVDVHRTESHHGCDSLLTGVIIFVDSCYWPMFGSTKHACCTAAITLLLRCNNSGCML